MITTGFDARVKVGQIIESQLPDFILDESPKAVDFLKQYYLSQDFPGGAADIAENLDVYLKLDNLTPEAMSGYTTLSSDISQTDTEIFVDSTRGFPQKNGLLKINEEIITYAEITANSFTGCVRGFSGITSCHSALDEEELIFSTSVAVSHKSSSRVENLSILFIKEFYKKLKSSLTPGLENVDFVENLDVSNFIKESKSFYQSKGTEESFRILFNILFGESPKIINLDNLLIKPSAAQYLRREVVICKNISGNPLNLIGQTIFKKTDLQTKASISNVEVLSRGGETFYRVDLFLGFSDTDSIQGNFIVTPKTKVIGNVSVGSSVITVDSTVGFSESGTVICGNNEINYTEKTINQFLGCSNINFNILNADDIRSDDLYFGYEKGDITKICSIRITGVLSDFTILSNTQEINENEVIAVKNIGLSIKNPPLKTFEETFANSWIYNTSTRYEVSAINGSTFTLLSEIDRSSLKEGDNVDILLRGSNTVLLSNATVSNINLSNKQITLNNIIGFTPNPSFNYEIRRVIKKARSSSIDIQYGNNILSSDVQNVYRDEEYFYVASNSLPSYDIKTELIQATIANGQGQSSLQGLDPATLLYHIISFSGAVPFITGDEVVYYPESDPIPGLDAGSNYFIKLDPLFANRITLYKSKSFIETNEFVEFFALPAGVGGSHTFVLSSQKDLYIRPQKNLVKFPISQNITSGKNEKTQPGKIGLLVNGVDILNYKLNDKIFYGPIESISLLNIGDNYDVINPPIVEVSQPLSGVQALIQPVVSGNVKQVLIDRQDFDIEKVISVTISGGNGSGCVLQPILEKRFREIDFDARTISNSGGVDIDFETISFLTNHNFKDGQQIVYNTNGNRPLGLGTYFGGNFNQNLSLVNGSSYYAKVINNKTIQLYPRFDDYISGINTIGFTTISASGIHKFRTFDQQTTIKEIKVINAGSGYQNRKLYINPEKVSITQDSIIFNNHNFNDGDIVDYQCTGTPILGLSTANSYYILKVDSNSFRLANAGIGASISSNYERRKFVSLDSGGSGYHIFKYPDITLSLNVSYGNNVAGIITVTPVVRGELIDAYLYEEGSGYGSETVNLHKKPKVIIKSGKNAELKPFVSNGSLIRVEVSSSGEDYVSAPDLIVQGSGVGAVLRANIDNGKVTEVIIINGGVNYDENTTVKVVPPGKNALIDVSIRSLTLNSQLKYGPEAIFASNNGLGYGWVGYTTSYGNSEFRDLGSIHSPIIGWAYDGNPIYGPYGYSDPKDSTSPIKILQPGYTEDSSSIFNRPSNFDPGFFVEDYKFVGSKDLDVHNGRYCVTPDFPNGTYAYFVGIKTDAFNRLIPSFPYFIGDTYRSKVVDDNFLSLDQSFDFNNSNIVRNTFPYKVNDPNASCEFLYESNEITNQSMVVETTTSGFVNQYRIIESGEGYSIGDTVIFDETGTKGTGLNAIVSSITGKTIVNIASTTTEYENVIFTWKDKSSVRAHLPNFHEFFGFNNIISVSGLSTFVPKLTGTHIVGITSDYVNVVKEVPLNTISGIVTDIYISRIPSSISIGSTLGIGTEFVSVLNTFSDRNIVRVKRGISGSAHTVGTNVYIKPNKLDIPLSINYFDSEFNEKVYFNPKVSVGVGSTASNVELINYPVGDVSFPISIETQSIYIPNHSFKTNQPVLLTKPSVTSASLSVGSTAISPNFNIPQLESQIVYVINKSKDYIGLATEVGLTTTGGVYFFDNGEDSYEYSLTPLKNQVVGRIINNKTIVSLSTSHSLRKNDVVNLSVNPEFTLGIGNSSSVYLKYNSDYDKTLINPVGFGSQSVDSFRNTINLPSHGYKTGDKIFYSSVDQNIIGLDTGSYYIYRIDDNIFQLCETLQDLKVNPIIVAGFGNTGGSLQEISLINPSLNVFRNNNIKFDTSNSSLLGYDLKFYTDSELSNEFISDGLSNNFNIEKSGSFGSINSYVLLNYSDSLPSRLFYNLQKSGFISTSDTDVLNYSQVKYINSVYSGTYTISGVGNTTFEISLREKPERDFYTNNQALLSYTTNSEFENGGVDKVNILFGGFGYKKVPTFSSINSVNGRNANITFSGVGIGNIREFRVLDQGFEYASDKTLRPEALVAPVVNLVNNNEITNIEILYAGRNYNSPPELLVFNPVTKQIIESGSLRANTYSSSISDIEILDTPRGLNSVIHEIYSINNSNGVGISSVITAGVGIVTVFLTTPFLGFSTAPFSVGDEILVENIVNERPGQGFNSKDYGFKFFVVSSYQNTIPAKLEYDISSVSTNPGLARTEQFSFASITKKTDYPIFRVSQDRSNFTLGEKIFIKSNTGVFFETDLVVTDFKSDTVKLFGEYELKIGDVIRGNLSGTLGTIDTNLSNKARFETSYSLKKNFGWIDDIGKLDEDYQVIEDNDYYQNLSYSIKSTKTYDEIIDSVNRLLHPTGLKNFSDTQVLTNASVSLGSTQIENIAVFDLKDEKRVDAINDYDLVFDQDIFTNEGKTYSKFIKFRNKKLSDYIECRTNRVINLDDIGPQFSNANTAERDFTDLYTYIEPFARFLVQIKDTKTYETQLTELVVLYTDSDVLIQGIKDSNVFTIEKGTLASGGDARPLADIQGFVDEFDNLTVRMFPVEVLRDDYDVKLLVNKFNTTVAGISSSLPIGQVQLYNDSDVCQGSSEITIFEFDANTVQSFIGMIHILDINNNEQNYYEVYVHHDGVNSYQSEFFVDNNKYTTTVSSISIGIVTSFIDSGKLKLNFKNTRSTPQQIRSKVIGFGTYVDPSIGNGNYRYALEGQDDERSARYVTNLVSSVGGASTSIVGFSSNNITSLKAYVNVSVGETSALHQLMVMHDGINIYTLQGPYLSIGSTSGIGTFGGIYEDDRVEYKFYPDPEITGKCEIITFTEQLYSEYDGANIPPPLDIGPMTETVELGQFNGVLGERINRLAFNLTYEGTSVFSKSINPASSLRLDPERGIFKVVNHFFSDGEEISYKEGSSFVGLDPIPLGIGATLVGGIVFTGDLLAGFSTITGISTSDSLFPGQTVLGLGIPSGSTIVSIGETFKYFIGNVSSASTIITGIANTSILNVGSGIFSGDGTSIGTIVSIGIGSVFSNSIVPVGFGVTYYSNSLAVSASLSTVSLGSSFRERYTSGVVTTTCPPDLYVIKVDNNNFKVTGTKNSGIGFTFTDRGRGNAHKFTMKKRNEKSIIIIDNVVQYPLSYTPITYKLVHNNGIGAGTTVFSITGISSIRVNDVLKVNDEYMRILNFGTSPLPSGPISGVGTYLCMEVLRGFSGSISTSHNDGDLIRIYRGSYTIEDSVLYLTQAPLGSGLLRRNNSNTLNPYSSFDGRVYFKQDYSTNKIYDDISDQFTGIGVTYTLTELGQNTTGIEPGNSILFNNQIFQIPTTSNNAGNNYELQEIAGRTDIRYTGITSSDGSIVKSLVDVNQNQLPRGGIIISLGSTNGLGYAIPKGASVGIQTGPLGEITDIIGYATTASYNTFTNFTYSHITGIATISTTNPHDFVYGDQISIRNLKLECPDGYANLPSVAISTVAYSKTTGIMTVTTASPHYLATGVNFRLRNLNFDCSGPSGITTNIFPDGTQGYIFTTNKIINSTSFETNVGISTITHNYLSGGTVEVGITTDIFPDERGIPYTINNFDYHKTTGVSTITFNYDHNFTISDTIKLRNIEFDCPIGAGATIGITSVTYDNVTGIMTVSTAWDHLLTASNTIRLFDLNFSCDSSGYGTTTVFPDGSQGYYFPVNSVGFSTEFTTNVGTSTISHYYTEGGYVQVGITTSIFPDPVSTGNPDGDYNYQIVSIPSANSIVVNVGPSTITHNYVGDGYAYAKKRVGPYRVRTVIDDNTFETDLYTVGFAHTYVSGGEVSKYYNFNIGSGYRGGEVGVYVTSLTGYGADITAITGIGGTLGFVINNGGSGYAFTNTYVSIPEPAYENLNIVGVSRVGIGTTTETGVGLLLSLEIGAAQSEYDGIVAITTAQYDNNTGILTVTTDSVHSLLEGDHLQLYDLKFDCPIGAGATIGITSVTYDNVTGIMTVSTNWDHLQTIGDTIRLFDLNFSCDSSGYGTTTLFPDGSQGYYFPVNSVGFSTEFTTNVGTSTISHYYTEGGYVQVGITTSIFPDGTRGYDYVVSEVVGFNTFTVNAGISSITHNYFGGGYVKPIGIGTETGEVRTFRITRPGYAFQRGDVFTAVGLVTAKGYSQPIAPFELTVLDVYTDSFAAWQFGELDFIDSIKPLQDGGRTRFPLLYNGQLLSFEKNPNDPDSALIDLDTVLLIFINGVPQKPGVAYQFTGGTSFTFTDPPNPEAEIAIFFYRGTRDVDSIFVNVPETIKKGDTVQLQKNNDIRSTIDQENRLVYEITSADKVETNLYSSQGIDDGNPKPMTWIKQKIDRVISGETVYKTRDILEAQVYPTAKIIKNLNIDENELFIDKPELFKYEENESALVIGEIDAIIIGSDEDPVAARIAASVSAGGTVQSLNVIDGGSGYTGSSVDIAIAAPKRIGIGIGSTATATASIVNGSIDSVSIVNQGLGYIPSNPPNVIAPVSSVNYEVITSIDQVFGFSGIVTGITTTAGISGHPLALKFFLNANTTFAPLLVGYPLNIFNTNIGSGVTSVDFDDSSIVGIGTSYLDNIYYIHNITFQGQNAEVITNIDSNSLVVGIVTVGSATTNVGRFSWGRLTGFARSGNQVSIAVTGFTVNPGLTTFPTIQRRGYGLRDGGSLRKILQ
jgi:hypothetical protein